MIRNWKNGTAGQRFVNGLHDSWNDICGWNDDRLERFAVAVDQLIGDQRVEAVAEAEKLMRADLEKLGHKGTVHGMLRQLVAELAEARSIVKNRDADIAKLRAAVEEAWGVIANAGGGDWSTQKTDWQRAASRWRDNRYHPMIMEVGIIATNVEAGRTSQGEIVIVPGTTGPTQGSVPRDPKDPHGCRFAGPGRGDCASFLGLTTLGETTVIRERPKDEHGKPEGWCWWCWLQNRAEFAKARADLAEKTAHDVCRDRDEQARKHEQLGKSLEAALGRHRGIDTLVGAVKSLVYKYEQATSGPATPLPDLAAACAAFLGYSQVLREHGITRLEQGIRVVEIKINPEE